MADLPWGPILAPVLFYGSLYGFARYAIREAADSLSRFEANIIAAQREAIEKAAAAGQAVQHDAA